MVIIAIPSMNDGGLNDFLNPRFGRCPCFTFIELENKEVTAVKIINNVATNSMGGAGIQAAQIVGENKADTVIINFLGPNAIQALKSFNIKIFELRNDKISIKDVLDLYNKGELAEINASNVNSHFGTNKNITNPN
ncbi:MAG: NifB/NifX family molybdenum-iron cluster-binding protein [Candidatus Lokiarchaeota archaeon]|nr:NifB/NifX family molybdenum-iron cluster-binding protein [Candidatus Lokiarchaeota archaeon]